MSDAPILGPLNLVDDLSAAGDFEKKHTPHIDVDEVDEGLLVTVTVGWDVPHPNQPDHYITWIELLAGEAKDCRIDERIVDWEASLWTTRTRQAYVTADGGEVDPLSFQSWFDQQPVGRGVRGGDTEGLQSFLQIPGIFRPDR